MKKRIFQGIVTSMAIFLFAITNTGAQEVSAVLRGGGGAVGGAGFVMLTGVSHIVSTDYRRIGITVVPGGWVGNVTRVNSGELDLASTSNTLALSALKQEKPLDQPIPNVRSLFNVQDTMYYFMFARKDFPADSVEEFFQKKIPARICTLAAGSVTEMQFSSALASQNLTWDNIIEWGGKVNFVTWGDAVNLIKDGHADIIAAAALDRAGWAMELATVRDMKVLEWSPDLLEAINKKTGTTTATMPGGLYTGIDYSVDCPASSGHIIINSNVPDIVAFTIVKAMAENEKAYSEHHASFKNFKAEGMPKGLYLPLHPGAKKYYMERGWVE